MTSVATPAILLGGGGFSFFVSPSHFAVELAAEYDAAVAGADPAEIRVRDSTRVRGLERRGGVFAAIAGDPWLRACAVAFLGPRAALGAFLARTVHPGADAQELHSDLGAGRPARMLGFIVAVDPFTVDNGATRFVVDGVVTPAVGPAGTLIVYDATIPHGFGPNRSRAPRRSIQGNFVGGALTSGSRRPCGR